MESSAASFSSSSSGAGSGAVDRSPLLPDGGSGRDEDWNRRFGRQAGLRGAARLLRRAGSRRAAMREPSIRVRETAAEQLEEAQSDWAYSRPVVVLDIVWNLAFVGAAAVVMVLSRGEAPSMPLRLWIAGYAMQCLLHMVCVRFEYRRRQELQRAAPAERVGGGGGDVLVGEVQPEGGGGGFGAQQMGQEGRTR